MAPKGIKASKLFERKSKAKVIEWVPQKRSRGTRYVPVELSTSNNPHTRRRDTVGSKTVAMFEGFGLSAMQRLIYWKSCLALVR
jgi:hypothetical protein